jgi:SpoIIAA-like
VWRGVLVERPALVVRRSTRHESRAASGPSSGRAGEPRIGSNRFSVVTGGLLDGVGSGALIEGVTDLPPGTLGFRASGKITGDEYRKMMEPIYAALERGDKLNIYFELADDFHGLDLGALWQDVQAAGSVGLKHRSSWQRMVLVTDKDWGQARRERVQLAGTGRTAPVRAIRAGQGPRLAGRDLVRLEIKSRSREPSRGR